MFIDVAKIFIKAGDGGDGAVAFHREKYVAAGGPDGGDGGRGGDIVFVADKKLNTLMDFKYKRKYVAENGENGGRNKCTGASASELIIRVPYGTLIRDKQTGLLIKDMSDDKPFVAAKGGRGGWGNQHFATATRQIPRFAKPGEPGEQREIILELKLIADVGLLGYPNVGKSTLLSSVSAARPKIANYHFTTLAPNLGVVAPYSDKSFVLADIPGIIEGAASGQGLGTEFLRHIERCRLLVHVVDVSGSEGRDPIEDYKAINHELKNYSETLSSRQQIVAANKIDAADPQSAERFCEYIRSIGLEVYKISAATGEGVKQLLDAVIKKLDTLPATVVFESEYVPQEIERPKPEQFSIECQDNVYYVEGGFLANILKSINFDDYESLQYFQRVLRTSGVIDQLEQMGINEGDTVVIYDLEFEYKR